MKLNLLQPKAGTIVLTIALMSFFNWGAIHNRQILDASVLVGIPVGFYPLGSAFLGGFQAHFSITRFLLDILFWYVISAIAIGFISRNRAQPLDAHK